MSEDETKVPEGAEKFVVQAIDHWGKESVNKSYLEQMGIGKDEINNKHGLWSNEINRLSEAGAQVVATAIDKPDYVGEEFELFEKTSQKAGEAVGRILQEIAPSGKCVKFGGNGKENMKSTLLRATYGPLLHSFYHRLILFNETGLISDEQKETIERSFADGTIMTNSMNMFGLPLRPPRESGLKGSRNPEIFYWAVRPSETPDTKTGTEE